MTRIDIELVNRSLFESRSKAKFAIDNNVVYCNNKLIKKASFDVTSDDVIEIKEDVLPYVSKGGLKLKKAVDTFKIDLTNKVLIDIGSSTGGFSDCAIKEGINRIIAVDVGSNQFSNKVLETGKVDLYENTDFRNMDNEIIDAANVASIDVSFISVTKILEKLVTIKSLKEVILLIKPQFECGSDIARKYKGVVTNKEVHNDVINKIINEFSRNGLYINNLTYSPILGGDGNIEYLAYFKKEQTSEKINVNHIINTAFKDLKKN